MINCVFKKCSAKKMDNIREGVKKYLTFRGHVSTPPPSAKKKFQTKCKKYSKFFCHLKRFRVWEGGGVIDMSPKKSIYFY